jgi:hypothetical protein
MQGRGIRTKSMGLRRRKSMRISTIKAPWFSICVIIAFIGLFAFLSGSSAGIEGVKKIPGIIDIKYIQREYGSVAFNHSKHAAMAGTCGKCHHMHNEKINSACRQCHALDAEAFKSSVKQVFLPCSACHTNHSPESPGVPGLKVALHKKCFECHIGMRELGYSPSGCVKTCHAKK